MKRKSITLSRIIRTGALNFVRNIWLAIAAMAIMLVTLTIILFSLIVNATFSNTVQQITNKIDVSMYLKDSVTPAQTKKLISELKALPNTQSVTYLDKDAALKAYEEQNAGNTQLLRAISETGNVIPATIKVKPKNLNQIDQISNFINKPDIKSLQAAPASDSGDRREAIRKITHATNILREAGVIAVIVFAVISVLIIFNTIQMAIFNRREELQIMRLLGATTWYIRGPFVVESVIYGIIAGLVSILLANAVFVTAASSLQASSFGLLDISYAQTYFANNFWLLLTTQLGLGILIGAASSVIATRRYLKFKTSKK